MQIILNNRVVVVDNAIRRTVYEQDGVVDLLLYSTGASQQSNDNKDTVMKLSFTVPITGDESNPEYYRIYQSWYSEGYESDTNASTEGRRRHRKALRGDSYHYAKDNYGMPGYRMIIRVLHFCPIHLRTMFDGRCWPGTRQAPTILLWNYIFRWRQHCQCEYGS